jgi:5-(carboxyamino)imidazole ribonucleotide mutase
MLAGKTHLPALGVSVGTLAIRRSGAVNAALLAASVLGLQDPAARQALLRYRSRQTDAVLSRPDPARD